MRSRPGVASLVLLGMATTVSTIAACGAPPRLEAVAPPATSVAQPGAVPGLPTPPRPPLSPAVAVSPSPPPAGSPAASPAASPSPAANASPVIHPTLPRVDASPTQATPAGR
jgi:hypothetical protein